MRKSFIVAFLFLFTVAAVAGNGDVRRASRPVPGSYIVVLEDFITDVPGAAAALARIHGGSVKWVYGAALAEMKAGSPQTAVTLLKPLVAQNPQLTLLQTSLAQAQFAAAIDTPRLEKLIWHALHRLAE